MLIGPPMASAADRARRHRQRRAQGRMHLAFDSDEDVIDALIRAGLLLASEADKSDAVRAAAEKALADWKAQVLHSAKKS